MTATRVPIELCGTVPVYGWIDMIHFEAEALRGRPGKLVRAGYSYWLLRV